MDKEVRKYIVVAVILAILAPSGIIVTLLERTRKENNRDHRTNMELLEQIDVKVDNRLQFEEHMQCKINKANLVMGLIYSHLNEETLLLLYKLLIRPHVEYVNQIWAPYPKKHITCLKNVHRRVRSRYPDLSPMLMTTSSQTTDISIPLFQLGYDPRPSEVRRGPYKNNHIPWLYIFHGKSHGSY